MPSPLGPLCQLGQQARLPDPRLANQLHDARLTSGEAVERPVEIGELARSRDQYFPWSLSLVSPHLARPRRAYFNRDARSGRAGD